MTKRLNLRAFSNGQSVKLSYMACFYVVRTLHVYRRSLITRYRGFTNLFLISECGDERIRLKYDDALVSK